MPAAGGRFVVGGLLLALTCFSAVGCGLIRLVYFTATGVTRLLWAARQASPMFDVYMPRGGIPFSSP